jgi:hypothetical protein
LRCTVRFTQAKRELSPASAPPSERHYPAAIPAPGRDFQSSARGYAQRFPGNHLAGPLHQNLEHAQRLRLNADDLAVTEQLSGIEIELEVAESPAAVAIRADGTT